jgi:hypothetical protein
LKIAFIIDGHSHPFKEETMKRILVALMTLVSIPQVLWANERRFTYTYESAVLDANHKELELWTTFRNGRATPLNDYLYSRFDHRAEFEMGLGGNLMTSFYLNWKNVVSEDLDPSGARLGTISTETEFQGISSEWKLKLSDPVADSIGVALYGEIGMGANELGVEGKLILDKKFGSLLVAYNFVIEKEYVYKPGGAQDEEISIENDLGITNLFTDNFSGGLEARQHAEFIPGAVGADPEHIAWFLGPVLSYTGSNWWITATCLFQLPALQRSTSDPGRLLVLDEHEQLNARVILSWGI